MNPNPEAPALESEPSAPQAYNKTRKTKEQHAKAAKLISEGQPISKALIASGWSPIAAQRGRRALTQPIMAELLKRGTHLKDLGRQALINPTEMHELAVGRTMYSALTGDEKGLQAAKQLGSHKSVNCWQPETQLAVQVNLGSLEALEDDTLIRTTPVVIK